MKERNAKRVTKRVTKDLLARNDAAVTGGIVVTKSTDVSSQQPLNESVLGKLRQLG